MIRSSHSIAFQRSHRPKPDITKGGILTTMNTQFAALGKSLEADGSEYADGAYLLQKTSQDAVGKIRKLLEKLNPPKERTPL